MDFPATQKIKVTEELFGHTISDPYRWLEDTESMEVLSWLDVQSAYSRSVLDSLPQRESLRQEFGRLYREETLGFPHPCKGRYFFMKRKADEDHSVLYVQEGLSGDPRILVDPNIISKEKGHPVSLYGYSVSKDATLITYNLSETSNDQKTMYVMNVDTGETLNDRIPAELYPAGSSWSVDNKGFWYSRRMEHVPAGEEKFHRKLYYHALGSSYTGDTLVYGEHLAKEDSVSAGATYDGRYLVVHVRISSEKSRRTEIYLKDLVSEAADFLPVVRDVRSDVDSYFSGMVRGDYFYIETDYQAPHGTIVRFPLTDIGKGMAAWQSVIPEHKERIISWISIIGDKLFVITMEDVHSVLREYSHSGEFRRVIEFPTTGTCNGVGGEVEGTEAFFAFDSFTYPHTIFRIDFTTDIVAVFKRQDVSIDVDAIAAEQVWFTSKDGTKVPMFLVYKKGLERNGKNPTVLYGYGGFNISMEPAFMKSIIPFLERGGLYVVTNLRGGGEFGEMWHQAGTKKNKQNTFDDFIAAIEWLIAHDYTDSAHVCISGDSNGGLLVGAVMTQRPDLVKAVIMGVPVVDMLRYHLFHGGRHWIPDWGSPEDPEMFEYLLGYSPYHNVREGVEYPATMIVTSDKDDRVHPGQAFKMTARLQAVNTTNPILLRLKRNAGHGGASDVSRWIDEDVDRWSFIFWQLEVA
jgi:prolyl oligopeptidase